MLKNLTFWAEIDEFDGFLVIFYSSKMLVQGLTTNGHHKSFFCYLFYVAIYMRYLKSVVRPLVLFFLRSMCLRTAVNYVWVILLYNRRVHLWEWFIKSPKSNVFYSKYYMHSAQKSRKISQWLFCSK